MKKILLFILLQKSFCFGQTEIYYWTDVSYSFSVHGYPELADSLFFKNVWLKDNSKIQPRTLAHFSVITNKLKNKERSNKYLEQAFLRGITKDYILTKIKKDTSIDINTWKKVIENYDSLHRIYKGKLDLKSIDFFNKIDTQERSIRKLKSHLVKKDSSHSLTKYLDSLDIQNTEMTRNEMNDYLLKNGLPDIEKVGYEILD